MNLDEVAGRLRGPDEINIPTKPTLEELAIADAKALLAQTLTRVAQKEAIRRHDEAVTERQLTSAALKAKIDELVEEAS